MSPAYEVFAIRYATSGPGRVRRQNFIEASDPHDSPMPLDYYVWAIIGAGRVIVVDTGFGPEAAEKRGRALLRRPVEALKAAGIDPDAVEDVIITHLHYDHAGCLESFPRARFHLQDAEMRYATGRYMCHACLRQPFEAEDVVSVVRLLYRERVQFHDGDSEIAPGVSVHRVGGHTGGLQVVRVQTQRGPLVLASDAFHFSENRMRRNPFPLVFHVGEMLEGYRRCEELANGDCDKLIPGHDPEVRRRWPRLRQEDSDIVCLHEAPSGQWGQPADTEIPPST
ncbi:N-acyl homoserine lactonase family protein [Terrarubrum flagellatum]|uniref:N-acyl homoserine lactonase family protein n=1 Tax=Terrirubrum flagellatum TaxID=2895980 RepID=UPI003144D739